MACPITNKRLGLGLGKLRYHTGGPGGLPPGLGFGLGVGSGKFRYRTGGPGGLLPGLRLSMLRYPTRGPEACIRGSGNLSPG